MNGLLGSAGIMLSGAGRAAAGGNTLVVPSYGGRWQKFWAEQLIPAFSEATGAQTKHDVASGATFVSNLRAAGDASPYSIFMGNENVSTMLRREGFFEPFDAARLPNLENVYDNLVNPGLNGVRGIISPIGIGYRTDLVKTPPKRWTDLWDNPEFRGQIALYQIGNTAAVLFLLLTARIYGGSEDKIDVAFEKIRQLLPFQQVSWSGAAATALVRGEALVAPVDWGEVIALRKKGAPVDMVVPEEGVVAFEQSFNLVKSGEAKDEAYDYLNFVLGAETQAMLSSAIYSSPCNEQSQLPDELARQIPILGDDMRDIISFDWDAFTPQVPEVNDRWNREMI